jgi:multiple sugar transport system permease protein
MTTSALLRENISGKPPKTRSHSHGRFDIQPYLLIAPTVVIVVGLLVVPIIIVIVYSLFDNVITDLSPQFVGLKNYGTILTDPTFWSSTLNTLIFTVGSVVVHMVLGMAFALMLNSKLIAKVPRVIFRLIYILPWIFTAAVVAVVWRLMLDPSGVINFFLKEVGVIHQAVPWFSDAGTALLSITVMNIWSGYPFFMISLLAGLQGVPTDLYEAARVDGAGLWRQFFSVTLPSVRPVLYSMALLDLLWTTQQFALFWLTTGGESINHTNVLSTYTYRLAFSSYQFSLASTAAVVILAASVVVAVFYVRQQKRVSAA